MSIEPSYVAARCVHFVASAAVLDTASTASPATVPAVSNLVYQWPSLMASWKFLRMYSSSAGCATEDQTARSIMTESSSDFGRTQHSTVYCWNDGSSGYVVMPTGWRSATSGIVCRMDGLDGPWKYIAWRRRGESASCGSEALRNLPSFSS